MGKESFKWLKTGAIQTDGWDASANDDGVRILTLESAGYVNCVAGDIGDEVHGNDTGHSGILLDYDNTLRKWWVRMTTTTEDFDTAEAVGMPLGGTGSGTTTGASLTGENLWANLYTLGTIESNTNIYIIQDDAKIDSWWDTGHIDVLVLVKEADTEIDNGELTIYGRQYQKTYDHFPIDVTPGGRNAVPLATQADLNNTTASGSVVSNVYVAQVNGQLVYWNYVSETGGPPVGGWSKWDVIVGQDSGASGIVIADTNYSNHSGVLTMGNIQGTFLDGEVLLKIDDTTPSGGVSGTLDVSIIFDHEDLDNGNGDRPYDIHCNLLGNTVANWYEYTKNITRREAIYTFYQNNGTSLYTTPGEQYISAQTTYTPVKAAPLGTFAGGTFFGAQGVWIENYAAADAKKFQLIDSSGVTQSPPNTVAVEVTSVASGDSVSVFVLESAGGDIKKDQYTGASTGNDSGNAAFVITGSIASDTPKAGYLRIIDPDDSSEDLYEYTTWSGGTFTIVGTLTRNYNESEDVYCPIIDDTVGGGETTIDNTLVQSTDIPILIRVRQYGILPFEVESTVTSVGASVAAIRVNDSIVS